MAIETKALAILEVTQCGLPARGPPISPTEAEADEVDLDPDLDPEDA